MKYIIKNITYSMTCLAMIFFMGSCNTDIESVDINEPGIDKQNPELYANYLALLRNYKESKHKVVFGWFDNSAKMPASQGQNIHSVPDSLDYVVLTNPNNLNARELSEIETIRENKGIRTLYEINYMTIRNVYDAEKQAFEENPNNVGKTFSPDFNTYLVDTVQARLALCEKYNYDGIVMTFYAKTKVYMTEKEKAEQIKLENAFLGISKDWKERHTNKILVLAGKPQNIEDKTILRLASYIVIPCTDATNEGDVTYNMNKAAVEGIPTDKFIPLVSLYALDETDTKTGYWGTTYAAIGAAKFVSSDHPSYQVAGLALDNTNNDYYHVKFVYPVVREAISIINPAVKK